MSATISLPSPLRARLTVLRWRIRLLRAVGGFALLVVLLGFLAAAAMLADYWLDLPALVRQIVFVTWLVIGAAWLLRGVMTPLCQCIDATALAAVVEERFPDLGERLSSIVELAGASAEGHGSPLFIALLVNETAVQSERLDFRLAVPARRTAVLVTFAATTVLLIAAPVLFWPQQYSVLAQRFFRPWNVPLLTEPPQEMAATQPVPEITPVELAADSPTITITPPAYARSVKQEETLHGLVDLAPVQYSEMHFDFRFTRPAVAAYLEWNPARETLTRPGESNREVRLSRSPLTLSADRQAASLTITAIKECQYRVILEAEQEVRTELPGGTIHVQLDQPPSVRRFHSQEPLRSVLPYERIPFEIEATDDIGVASIELEYRVNDGESVRQPLALEGSNTPSAAVRNVLELAGKVQEDDHFFYRFRVSDNLPQEYQGPHVIFYPPDRWLTLQIARHSDPLQKQEILAQRDEINRRLQAIRASLLREERAVDRIRQETRDQKVVLPDRLDRIQQLQHENQTHQKALRELAQLAETPTGETPVSPALEPIAELARDVADQELHKGQQALDRALQEEWPVEQALQLKTVGEQLQSAVKRLDELKKKNDQLAQERLDRMQLEMLAEREKHLAEQTAELAAKHPVLDPKAHQLAEKIQREQADAVDELERLAQRNEVLKQALRQAQGEQAQQLAERARELAQTQRDLAQAQAETERKHAAAGTKRPVVSEDPIEELAQKQMEVAKQAEELARKIGQEQGEEAAVSKQAQQARQAAEEVSQQLQTGTVPQARQAGQQTAEQLRQLAVRLAQTPRRGDHWRSFDPLLRTRQLGQQQAEINRHLRLLEGDTRALLAHQRTRQRRLQQETDELSKQFHRLSQQARGFQPIQSALQRAASESRQAEQAMQQARDQDQRGDIQAEKLSQDRAAQFLDQAARAVTEVAHAHENDPADEPQTPETGERKAGRSAIQAGQQMAEAQGQLKRGQAAQAQATMRQAAQLLAQAAQYMAALPAGPQRQQGMPTGLGRQPGGLPDLSAYGLDQAAYAGKSWGELPGELRTRIVQDIKARYGDDYARMIKSYFEQIADTNKVTK